MRETLPKGWVETQFSNYCLITMGQSPPGTTYNVNGNGLPFFQGKAEFGKTHPTPKKYCSAPKKTAEKGDILLSVRAPVGPTNICENYSCIGRGLASIRAYQKESQSFIYFYLLSIENWLSKQGAGSTFQAIGKEFIYSLPTPIPPLNEQKRIVAKLDAIIPRIDLLKTRLDKIPVLIKRFRQSVLTAAVTGKLTETWRDEHSDWEKSSPINIDLCENRTPKNWKYILFQEIITELRNGVSLKPNINPPGTKILRISANRSGAVNLNDFRYIPDGKNKYERYLLNEGDLLFTRYNGNIDLVGVCGQIRNLSEDYLYPDKLMRVKANETLCDICFLEYIFQTGEIRKYITSKSKTSAGQNGLSGKDLKLTPLPLPPLEEQKEIVRQVDKLFALADKLEARYQKAKTGIDKLSQSVLAKAFRGELVPQDPDDEPAEKLLERIMAEKAEMERAKKGHKKKGGGQKAKAGSRK